MFAIVTDSTVYLSRKEAVSLGVHVLPMLYSVGTMSLTEGYLDENGRYKDLLAHGADQHTAQVSISTYMSAFNELIRKGHNVLCITISSRLSGAFSSAMIAAKEFPPDRILVVDSLSTAGGMRFLVERASQLSRENRPLQEAADVLEKLRDSIGIALSVDDMSALRRSGRLSLVRQSVGTVLNIRPIFLLKNGTVISNGVARGKQAQVAELVRCIPSNAKSIIVHGIANRAAVESLQRLVRQKFSCEVRCSDVGPVLTIHLGLSAVGVAWCME
jgi:DegV family protein with EDD domain